MRKKAHGSPHLPQDNGVWPIWIDQRANKALSQVFDLRNFISLGEQRIRPSRTSPQKKLVGVAPNGRVALAGGSFERSAIRDVDVTTPIVNHALRLQQASGNRD
jgi:hypothetical protein